MPLLIPSVKFIFVNNSEVDNPFKYNLSGMKFDCIIMNPPYGSNKQKTANTLHYDITSLCIKKLNKTGKCVSLMPTSIIKNNTKKLQTIKTDYDLYLENITEIDGNLVFNTSMQNIGIFTFNKCKKDYDEILIQKYNSKTIESVKSLLEFDYFSSKTEQNILNKINNGCPTIYKNRAVVVFGHGEDKTNLAKLVKCYMDSKKIIANDYFIFVNYANGGLNAIWQTTKLATYGIVDKQNLQQILMTDTKAKTVIGFKKDELLSVQNILTLLKTNCLRFGLSKLQSSQTLTGKVYLAFPDIDYTNIDTEEKFYKHFNITPDEQKIIEETMEKYK